MSLVCPLDPAGDISSQSSVSSVLLIFPPLRTIASRERKGLQQTGRITPHIASNSAVTPPSSTCHLIFFCHASQCMPLLSSSNNGFQIPRPRKSQVSQWLMPKVRRSSWQHLGGSGHFAKPERAISCLSLCKSPEPRAFLSP